MSSSPPSQLPPSVVADLYRSCFPLLRAKCRRMLAADAEDVAQEVFVRLLESDLLMRSVTPSQPELLAWLYRTSTRAAIDKLRKQRVRAQAHGAILFTAIVPGGSDAGSEQASTEDAVHARRLIEYLARAVPVAELEVVILHRLDLMTQPEVAGVTSLSERTVRRLLRRFDERVAVLSQPAMEKRTG
jgi:RNA polymerase sigma-70 factor, ECF subfamily